MQPSILVGPGEFPMARSVTRQPGQNAPRRPAAREGASEDHEVIQLGLLDARILAEALLNPGEPGPKLREAAAWYRQVVGEFL